MLAAMVSFDPVADEYESGRPDHPAGVYDGLEPLAGRLVLEGGAGTGISTRRLVERGAVVVPFDIGSGLLHRAAARTPGLRAVVADGAVAPFRDACADLVCFGQAWHWLDPERRGQEAARVLRAGGRWAGWWSHARADDEAWFDAYWRLVERACGGTHRDQRDIDWGATVAATGLFVVANRVTVPWTRQATVDTWMTDQASHSYVMSLPAGPRAALLAALREIVEEAFPDGQMRVPYETWLWVAEKR